MREFTRRLVFCVLVGNGDAHLKNWSLIYRDLRGPTLAPTYDLVVTFLYQPGTEDLGLMLNRSRRFADVRSRTFGRIADRVHAEQAELGLVAEETIARTIAEWPTVAGELLSDLPEMRQLMGQHIRRTAATLRSS